MTALLMKPWTRRALTEAERMALSPGLWDALSARGISPVIVARPSLPALIVGLWRRSVPVMVLGRRIFWPGAQEDFSNEPLYMSVLQHELQHVLEFGAGELTRLRYLLRPSNWIYRYRLSPGARWIDFGAEQRAMIVQHLWLAERGLLTADVSSLRALIPWAR